MESLQAIGNTSLASLGKKNSSFNRKFMFQCQLQSHKKINNPGDYSWLLGVIAWLRHSSRSEWVRWRILLFTSFKWVLIYSSLFVFVCLFLFFVFLVFVYFSWRTSVPCVSNLLCSVWLPSHLRRRWDNIFVSILCC